MLEKGTRDNRSFQTQLIEAVRSVGRSLGATYSSGSLYGNEYNQYEVQLIDAVKGIGRTLSGKGLSVSGSGIANLEGYVTQGEFQALSHRVAVLESESFFRLVDGNVTLKEGYSNLWVQGWLSAGGVGSGGGGGGASSLKELSDVYHSSSSVLRADGTPVQNGDTLVYDSTNTRWVAAAGGGGGSSVAWGLSGADYQDLAVDGTTKRLLTAHQSLSGYVPTSRTINGHALSSDVTITKGDIGLGNVENTALSSWTGSGNISTVGTITSGEWRGTRIANAYLAHSSVRVGSATISLGGSATLTQIGIPTWAQASTPVLYVARTSVTLSPTDTTLLGVQGFTTASSATASGDTSLVEWVPDAGGSGVGAWHFKGNVYADGWIAAGGIGSGGGGGGTGSVAGVKVGSTTYSPDANGIVSIPAYPTTLPASDVYSWAKQPNKPTYTFAEITSKPTTVSGYGITDAVTITGTQTITGQKTFSTNNVKLTSVSILPSTDDTCGLGSGNYRFNSADIRNIYTSYFKFIDGTTKADRGNITMGDGYASMSITKSGGSDNYMFYRTSGFFFDGNSVELGKSDHRWSTIYGGSVDLMGGSIHIRDASTGKKNLAFFGVDGYALFRYGEDCDDSDYRKDIIFHPEYGFYPNQSGVNLGYNGNNYRWATIYGVNGNLTGNLAMTATSVITLGPVIISYDSTNKALHVSGTDTRTIGFYCDGWVAAGGIQQTS